MLLCASKVGSCKVNVVDARRFTRHAIPESSLVKSQVISAQLMMHDEAFGMPRIRGQDKREIPMFVNTCAVDVPPASGKQKCTEYGVTMLVSSGWDRDCTSQIQAASLAGGWGRLLFPGFVHR
jgi:hypothetical protein